MSIRASTTVGVSKQCCCKAIKPLVCLACIVVCLLGLVPTASAVGESDFPNLYYSSANLVTLTAIPDGAERISVTNPVWATLDEYEGEEGGTFTKQATYTLNGGEDDYYFNFDNPITIAGYFQVLGNQVDLLVEYTGGDNYATYSGFLYYKHIEEGYIERISEVSGSFPLTIGEYTELDIDTLGIVLPSDFNPLTTSPYFVGEIEVALESYGGVNFGLRNTVYPGDYIRPLFHTSESLDISVRPPLYVDGNATYRTAWIADGTLYYTPSVRVNVVAESHTHSWLLRSIEPVFNTPIFGNGFTIGTLIVILIVLGLIALILKLSFGG